MKKYTWEEYYENFWGWAESTQVRYLSGLTSLGPADQVAEVINQLQLNEPVARRLFRKAVDAKLAFNGSDLMEMAGLDEALANAAARNSAARLTAQDMEDLYGIIDDEVIIEICRQRNLPLPEYLREEEDDVELDAILEVNTYLDDYSPAPPKRKGLLAAFLSALSGGGEPHKPNPQKHDGHCNGDCKNCPPHYGYRYGRWYYGHDHMWGCEFGGNKGSGSMD